MMYLVWCSSSPVLFPFPILTNLQLHSIYTALGGIAKYGEISNKYMTLKSHMLNIVTLVSKLSNLHQHIHED